MKNIHTLMEHGKKVPGYMLSGTLGDFSSLPEVHLWYGSDEILYACAEDFENRLSDAGIPYQMHIGEGMCHCYPLVSFFPEGKEEKDQICQIIKNQ